MRAKSISLCLALCIWACALGGCGGFGTGDPAEDSPQDASTLAPTTSTTLSQGQLALATMTPRQKVAQVLLFSFSGTTLTENTAALIAAGPPGGLLVFGRNVVDVPQMQALTASLQQAAAATGSPVGMFIAVDQEGGQVRRIKQGVPEMPSARALGSGSTPAEASQFARQTAHGLLEQGMNMNLAPVADVVGSEGAFMYSRSYGGDPDLVSAFVTAFIQASQGQRIINVVKHFPGHGSAPGDTHTEGALSSATRQDFEAVHLPPFRAAMTAGVEGVMISHIVAGPYDGERPASLSRAVISGLLRQELGFEGLVVTDDLSMAAALGQEAAAAIKGASTDEEAAQLRIAAEVRAAVTALEAGCDLLIISEWEPYAMTILDALTEAVEGGEVSQARLDEAVLRILDLKYRYDITPPQRPLPTSTAQQTQEATP